MDFQPLRKNQKCDVSCCSSSRKISSNLFRAQVQRHTTDRGFFSVTIRSNWTKSTGHGRATPWKAPSAAKKHSSICSPDKSHINWSKLNVKSLKPTTIPHSELQKSGKLTSWDLFVDFFKPKMWDGKAYHQYFLTLEALMFMSLGKPRTSPLAVQTLPTSNGWSQMQSAATQTPKDWTLEDGLPGLVSG